MAPGRRRVVVTKPSGNGCRTCRIRRVKCGEERPHCLKCSSTGRICDGYDLARPIDSAAAATRPLLPFHVHASTSPLAKVQASGPASAVALNDVERFAFDYFVRETAEAIRRSSPEKGWISLALQLSHEAAPVTLAITALGCAHRSQLGITHTTLVQPLDAEHHDLSIRQYTKTLRVLQEYIDSAILRSTSIEPILLVCLLLACLEVFHGRSTAAVSHLHSGRRIIEAHTSSLSGGTYGSRDSLIPCPRAFTAELAKTFERLDKALLSQNYEDGPRHPFQYADCERGTTQIRPPLSATLVNETMLQLDRLVQSREEAQAELLRIAWREMPASMDSLLDYPSRYCLAHCMTRLANIQKQLQRQRRIQSLVDGHEDWRRALAGIDVTNQQPRQRQILLLGQIQHFFSSFMLLTCRQTREVVVDGFNDEFVRALRCVEQYLQDVGQLEENCPKGYAPAEWNQPEMSSLQTIVLPALNLICFKCRDPDIRRQAISLLYRCNRQEGLFWSRTLAAYAEAIQQIEELEAWELVGRKGGTDVLGSIGVVPEGSRFCEVVLAPDLLGRPESVRIIGARFTHQQNRQICLVEYCGFGYPIRVEKIKQTTLNLEQGLSSCH